MKKLVISIVFFVLLTSFISAETKLICLEKGEIIKFSMCNANMEDRVCDYSSGCQYCVDEVSDGVYCPLHVNKCNAESLTCQNKNFNDSGFQVNDTNIEDNKNNFNNNQNSDQTAKKIILKVN